MFHVEHYPVSVRLHSFQPATHLKKLVRPLFPESREQRVVRVEFALPQGGIDAHHAREAPRLEFESRPVEILVAGREAERGLARRRLAGAALESPRP